MQTADDFLQDTAGLSNTREVILDQVRSIAPWNPEAVESVSI